MVEKNRTNGCEKEGGGGSLRIKTTEVQRLRKSIQSNPDNIIFITSVHLRKIRSILFRVKNSQSFTVIIGGINGSFADIAEVTFNFQDMRRVRASALMNIFGFFINFFTSRFVRNLFLILPLSFEK